MPQTPLPPLPPKKKYFIIECHFDELEGAYFLTDYMNKLGHYYTISVTTKEGQFDVKSVTVDEFKKFNNIP
jgi:hypothetical protein